MWDSTSRIRTKIWGKKWKMQWWKARLLRWNLEPICSHQVTKQRNQLHLLVCSLLWEYVGWPRKCCILTHHRSPAQLSKIGQHICDLTEGRMAGSVSGSCMHRSSMRCWMLGCANFAQSFGLFFGSYVLFLNLLFYICNTCSTLLGNLARFKLGFPQNLHCSPSQYVSAKTSH